MNKLVITTKYEHRLSLKTKAAAGCILT